MPVLVGFDAHVRFLFATATTVMHAVRWSVAWRVDALDETTFVNANWGQYNFGVRDFDVSVDCLYDTTTDPFGGLSNVQNITNTVLQPGTFIGMKIEVTEAHASRFWNFPVVLITDVRMDDSVRDLVRWSVTGKASNQISDSGGPALGALAPTLPTL